MGHSRHFDVVVDLKAGHDQLPTPEEELTSAITFDFDHRVFLCLAVGVEEFRAVHDVEPLSVT